MKDSLRLQHFCDFYLKFCKISDYQNSHFSEIIQNFAKFTETDFEFRCKSYQRLTEAEIIIPALKRERSEKC